MSKTTKQLLAEKGITEKTIHHSYDYLYNTFLKIGAIKDMEIERINGGMKQIINKDYNRPPHQIIEIIKMVHTPIGEFICQRDMEGESKCDNSCEHCQEYYKPLIEDRK